MPAFSSPNLRLLPALASGLSARAAEYRLPRTKLVSLLLRNDEIAPKPRTALPAAKLSRVIVPCGFTAADLRQAGRGARRCGLSRNAYLEALIADHLADPGPLVVLRSKATPKL